MFDAGSVSELVAGAGLGLPLAKRFVELHGGRIWAGSEGENKGSTFTFFIPAGQVKPEKPRTARKRLKKPPPNSSDYRSGQGRR